MAVFNPEQAAAFKAAVQDMYSKNEAPAGSVYKFTLSTGKSTYSFGQCQWDVGARTDAQDFLKGLRDEDGNQIFTDADIQNLSKRDSLAQGDSDRYNSA